MDTFKCTQCGQDSGFKNQLVYHLDSWDAVPLIEDTRTYECEHCTVPNQVTMTQAEWTALQDRSRGV